VTEFKQRQEVSFLEYAKGVNDVKFLCCCCFFSDTVYHRITAELGDKES
jgi:hypothetical protein